VDIADDGGVRINEADYFRSGWAIRNMHGTPIECAGRFLFPNPDRMVTDLSPDPIRAFLVRMAGRSNHPFDPSALAKL
jgi:hypothetical protein